MNRIVVLGAGNIRQSWLNELLARLTPSPRFLRAESAGSECDGLLVVDDGSSDGFAAIRSAIALRSKNPELPIAVVTTLDQGWTSGEMLTRSQRREASTDSDRFMTTLDGVTRVLRSEPTSVSVRIASDAITFDYDG